METIRTYLNNMLAAYPKTPELMRMKEDILSTMEDKYNELKAEGKTENEAVGIVISEFGNIDELMQEMNVQPENLGRLPAVDMATAMDFVAAKKQQSRLVSTGVLLCILAHTVFMAIADRPGERTGFLGLLCLFLFIAVGVGLFIFSGFQTERFKFMEGQVYIPADVKEYAFQQQQRHRTGRNIGMLVGIMLFFLSLIVFFLLSEFTSYDGATIVAMLALIAVGVFILILSSNTYSAFNVLLQTEEYAPVHTRSGRIIGAIGAVWWPVTVVVYLAWSFISGSWGITWVVWPVAGILFGAVSGAISSLYGEKR